MLSNSQLERPISTPRGNTLRDETDADLLIEHLQDLFARASLQELAMHLQTLDRLNATLGRA